MYIYIYTHTCATPTTVIDLFVCTCFYQCILSLSLTVQGLEDVVTGVETIPKRAKCQPTQVFFGSDPRLHGRLDGCSDELEGSGARTFGLRASRAWGLGQMKLSLLL